jgi:hypothetical protein
LKPLVLTLVCAAWALGTPGAASAQAPHGNVDDAKAAAHASFDKGLAASNDQRFADAASEFEKAYALWPDYRVLYNIGKVRATLGQSVEASAAFEAYLEKGGAEIPAERRQEVRDALAAQQAHVATVAVTVSDAGADVRLDGKLVGVSPLTGPLRVVEGKHTIEALLPGRLPQLRELDLPGASALEVTLAFPPAARLAAPSPALSSPAVALVEKSAPVPPRRSRALGYTVAAVGLVATVAGVVLAYQGATDANAARARLVTASMPAPPAMPDVDAYDAAKVSFDDARTRNELGWALVAVGSAAIVGGAALSLFWVGSSAGVRGSW